MAKRLSVREREVLKMAAKGSSMKEIGQELRIQPGVATRYCRNARTKMGHPRDIGAAYREAVKRGEL